MLCHDGVHSSQCTPHHEHSSFPDWSWWPGKKPAAPPNVAKTGPMHGGAPKGAPPPNPDAMKSWHFLRCTKCVIGEGQYEIFVDKCLKEHPFAGPPPHDKSFLYFKTLNEAQRGCVKKQLDDFIQSQGDSLKDVVANCKQKKCDIIFGDQPNGTTPSPPKADNSQSNSTASTASDSKTKDGDAQSGTTASGEPAKKSEDKKSSLDDLSSLVLLRTLTQLRTAGSGTVFL